MWGCQLWGLDLVEVVVEDLTEKGYDFLNPLDEVIKDHEELLTTVLVKVAKKNALRIQKSKMRTKCTNCVA